MSLLQACMTFYCIARWRIVRETASPLHALAHLLDIFCNVGRITAQTSSVFVGAVLIFLILTSRTESLVRLAAVLPILKQFSLHLGVQESDTS